MKEGFILKGLLLGKVGSMNLTKFENKLRLECVLVGEGFCVNPSTDLFTLTLDIDAEDKESIKTEANNAIFASIWNWMSAVDATDFNQLVGRDVVLQVNDDDTVTNFNIVSKEEAEKFQELFKKQEEEKNNN